MGVNRERVVPCQMLCMRITAPKQTR
uniref:Uncharacterized protein n=1 Tax=Arundo donax TaxID=35708 RepID=A0A0A8YJ62_ARUDO